jgi:hypothetical protein
MPTPDKGDKARRGRRPLSEDPAREPVRIYLEELSRSGPRRGRPRRPEKVRDDITSIEAEMGEAPVLRKLALAQRRLELLADLEQIEGGKDRLSELEEGFVKFAKDYAERRGISYGAWRELGVPARVLALAGLAESPGRTTSRRRRGRRPAS